MEKNEKKKNNRPARIKPRNKHSYAQYVWIRNMFLRLDEIDARLNSIENFLELLDTSGLVKDIARFHKVNKEGNEQSNKVDIS